ncbi:hypothetical protein UA08_05423 [Talaromyces atroroseus]|uniref:Fungal N-terminal domain-containing protein n=1 Tax=Talaromyces atroroseus TaxID=1441469 RepID=A0A225B150_TALAT|nr:hypothetical protein UA08_05423 [Talaromyces atroroseus]OKL59527.1 hypothetical protein UA08_05423 [Talaromyces atroroseus]
MPATTPVPNNTGACSFLSEETSLRSANNVIALAGVANTVTRVAGAGLRLALLLNAVACQVAPLGVDIHSISKGIALFSTSLKQLGQSLQAEHSVHARECVDTAHQISYQAQAVFEEVEDMLDKVQKHEPNEQAVSVQQRFRTCFKKQRVTYLLAQLESLKLSLMVMLQILHLGRLQEIKSVLNTLADELIVQERADAQNMLIVRYWSTKRLDRLWELARQEAIDTAPSSSRLDTTSGSPMSSKFPVIPLGVESSLNFMEESPNDMLRLTAEVLDALLKRWIRIEAGQQHVKSMLPAYVSSGSDDEISDSDEALDRSPMQGYFIEGVTTNWREPHSQEARMKAAQLRKLYSNKQAHVHSDSEDSMLEKKSSKKSSRSNSGFADSDSDNMPEQGLFDAKEEVSVGQSRDGVSRPYSYSTANTVPGCDANNYWQHEGIPKNPQPAGPAQTQVPPKSRPIPVPQANINRHPDRLATSQPAWPPPSPSNCNSMSANSSSSFYKTAPTSTGFPVTSLQPRQQPRYPQHQQRNPTYPPSHSLVRTLSDNSVQPQQYSTTPSTQPHRHRSLRNSSGSNNNNNNRRRKNTQSPAPAPHDRHRDLKRTAMRGILGASAIGGFMDALEAFSII